MVRINRYIAACTDYSRRQAEAFVSRRQVTVNGALVTELGFQVGVSDVVKIDGKVLLPKRLVYYIINKPTGYTSTVKDIHADKVVTELVPENPPVYPVGRLDRDSRGLLILTNDGNLTQQITHPKYEKPKVYEVTLDKPFTPKDMRKLQQGVSWADDRGVFDSIQNISNTTYRITIHQGKKRQIRNMCGVLGYRVFDLKRTDIAGLKLFDLEEGSYRTLTQSDMYKYLGLVVKN